MSQNVTAALAAIMDEADLSADDRSRLSEALHCFVETEKEKSFSHGYKAGRDSVNQRSDPKGWYGSD